MTTRAASIAPAAVALLLLLTGCVSHHPPPPSFTDAQRTEYFESRIDAAWLNLGLEGQFERPHPPMSLDETVNPQSLDPFTQCMVDNGLDSWSMGEENGGPTFQSGSGGDFPPEVELAAFTCFASFPGASSFGAPRFTDAQVDYLYDYYQSWVIPCLEVNGYPIDYFPDRVEFEESRAGWIPYFAIRAETGIDGEQFEAMTALCGNPFADLDVETPGWFSGG